MGEAQPLAARAATMAGALLLRFLLATPRRQFNLARWAGRRKFRELRGLSVTWLDSHFGMIEQGAPWLHRVPRYLLPTSPGH